MPKANKFKRWSRLWSARDGLGAIEFGFIAPVLATILIGVLDFGLAYWQQMEIASAADAGAQWGMTNNYNSDSIKSVVQAATNLTVSSSNITPQNTCGCATSTGVTTYSCTDTCPDTSAPKTYIIVNAHVCYKPIFSWPGLNYCSGSDSSCTGCSSTQISLSSQAVVLKN